MYTFAEENYIKAIFKIAEREQNSVGTNAISSVMKTSAASVSDMLRKLSDKELIHYEKYKGVTLTTTGSKLATQLIRKHRLWEVFLVDKLKFRWDQVHDIAEELEHINSDELIRRLDVFLGSPKFDPHGDPIPNAQGKFTLRNQVTLTDLQIEQQGVLVGVKEHTTPFLEYLNDLKIGLGTHMKVVKINAFDESFTIIINQSQKHNISKKTAANLQVKVVK